MWYSCGISAYTIAYHPIQVSCEDNNDKDAYLFNNTYIDSVNRVNLTKFFFIYYCFKEYKRL